MSSDKLLELALDVKHEQLMRTDLEYTYENICNDIPILEAIQTLKKAEQQFKHFGWDIEIKDILKELA